ncbi:MAG: FeoB-associated Cys-rich membrane protein [Cyclobacteriaceae bacterium]
MVQYILIGLLVLGALAYLGWMIYTSFTSAECKSGCGSCSTLDIKAIQKSIAKKKASA